MYASDFKIFESFDSSSFEDAGYILDDDDYDDYSDCDLF